jgi:hypothetical protein
MSAKDTTLTSTSIRRSAWAEQLLGDAPQNADGMTSPQSPRDAEAEARSKQFFAQVLRNLDRLEKLTAEQEVPADDDAEMTTLDGHGDGYEWAQLVDPTGTAAMTPRLARAKASARKAPIVALNAASFAMLGASAITQNWWPLPAAAFMAAAASLMYLRGCRGSWRLRAL